MSPAKEHIASSLRRTLVRNEPHSSLRGTKQSAFGEGLLSICSKALHGFDKHSLTNGRPSLRGTKQSPSISTSFLRVKRIASSFPLAMTTRKPLLNIQHLAFKIRTPFNIQHSTFNIKPLLLFFILHFTLYTSSSAQPKELSSNNIVWTSQSKNSSESMPCGGGDIGLNVWVENNELLFYISRSGTFDENNTLLKLGRVRIKLSPNPFDGGDFKQELQLQEGHVKISGSKGKHKAEISVWVDVFNPVIHVDITSNQPVTTEASYENWRYKDRVVKGRENLQNSYKFAPQGEVKTLKDEIAFLNKGVRFYHRNKAATIFDATVAQQELDSVKHLLYNPLKHLTFGGEMYGDNMKPAGTYFSKYADTDFEGWTLKSVKPTRSQKIDIYLATLQDSSVANWQERLNATIDKANAALKTSHVTTINWWHDFWNNSFIFIKPTAADTASAAWQAGRNYQLFHYMLGCNAYGSSPTKFNGGLFTYDPSFVDSNAKYTPDYRNWGGGTHTAQNQRLVYFPMIKSGDFEMLKPQLDFYMRILKNAELRSKVYWNHNGGCFTEQIENFGLPNPAEYSWKRPEWFDKGMQYNAWLEYQWDTVLEFCLMMLELERYNNEDISVFIPFIESCLTFFDEHYEFLAKLRGRKTLDENGHRVFYPGSAAETYKMAYNSTSTVAGLATILERLLELPSQYGTAEQRKNWKAMLSRIPPVSFSSFDGKKTIAPAKVWERINNTESPQLYPVFPWGMYGVGKPGIDVAINTYKLDTNVVKFRSHVGWKQDNIFAARLGLTDEAARLTVLKLKNSGRRFPAFWGPGYDWTPDHNWGGSGMIGLQEMLLQTDVKKILLFPAWPKDWDVHFKLHAPYNTTVEAVLNNGKVEVLNVFPEERRKDVVNMLE